MIQKFTMRAVKLIKYNKWYQQHHTRIVAERFLSRINWYPREIYRPGVYIDQIQQNRVGGDWVVESRHKPIVELYYPVHDVDEFLNLCRYRFNVQNSPISLTNHITHSPYKKSGGEYWASCLVICQPDAVKRYHVDQETFIPCNSRYVVHQPQLIWPHYLLHYHLLDNHLFYSGSPVDKISTKFTGILPSYRNKCSLCGDIPYAHLWKYCDCICPTYDPIDEVDSPVSPTNSIESLETHTHS
jgi:hypothetical protein